MLLEVSDDLATLFGDVVLAVIDRRRVARMAPQTPEWQEAVDHANVCEDLAIVLLADELVEQFNKGKLSPEQRAAMGLTAE